MGFSVKNNQGTVTNTFLGYKCTTEQSTFVTSQSLMHLPKTSNNYKIKKLQEIFGILDYHYM